MFIWDEEKRESNIVKHGLDFLNADRVLNDLHVCFLSSYQGDEERFLAVGKILEQHVTVVYTMRGDNYRIISMRRARNGERRAFEVLYG
jgi:uncharacterized protein